MANRTGSEMVVGGAARRPSASFWHWGGVWMASATLAALVLVFAPMLRRRHLCRSAASACASRWIAGAARPSKRAGIILGVLNVRVAVYDRAGAL